MPATDTVVVRSPRALWRAGAFGVVVLGPDAPTPLVLEGTGVDLWEALAVPQSLTELAMALGARYAVDAELVARDIGPVVDALVGSGACEVSR